MGGGGGGREAYIQGTCNWDKKAFQNISYKAVLIKILFEFTHFFKLQSVVKNGMIIIHFNTS